MNGTPAVDLTGIEPCFHEVVATHGREMFELVTAAGIGGEAAERLSGVLQRQHSSHGLQALGFLANSFNQISNAYVTKMGWTQEQLAACDQAVKLAFASKLSVVEKPAIILTH